MGAVRPTPPSQACDLGDREPRRRPTSPWDSSTDPTLARLEPSARPGHHVPYATRRTTSQDERHTTPVLAFDQPTAGVGRGRRWISARRLPPLRGAQRRPASRRHEDRRRRSRRHPRPRTRPSASVSRASRPDDRQDDPGPRWPSSVDCATGSVRRARRQARARRRKVCYRLQSRSRGALEHPASDRHRLSPARHDLCRRLGRDDARQRTATIATVCRPTNVNGNTAQLVAGRPSATSSPAGSSTSWSGRDRRPVADGAGR